MPEKPQEAPQETPELAKLRLEEAEERMRLMLDTNPLCCSFWDEDHNMIDCNEETARVFGLPDKRTFLDDFLKLSPEYQPDGQLSKDKAKFVLNEAFEKGRIVFEWMHQNLNGEPIPAEVTLVRMKRGGSPIVAGYTVLGYLRDLREHKRMMSEIEEALDRFRVVWENVECGIAIIDAETREIVDLNPVALQMFGAGKSEVVGKRCHKYICPATENFCPIMDLNQTVDRSERKFIKADGSVIPIIKSVAKIQYMGRLMLLESFTDITVIIEAEEQLRQMEVIEQANRAKSAFLARMSHEIRTPMNSVIGFSELALDDDISEKTRDYLNQIMENSSWLLQIINDLLDISKIESGKMEVESIPFNLNDVFSYCKSVVTHRAIRKNISLFVDSQTDLNRNLIGDPTKLRQVLLNLLTNAVKFTETGSVELRHKIVKKTEDSVTIHFEVKDTGIGISPGQIEQIFEPFSQADVSITRKYGGTGLGLPITKNMLELMGSRLIVKSAPGAGSTFGFELTFGTADISDVSYRLKNADLGIEKPVFRGAVLVCEDNQMNQRVITEHLQRVGLNVEIAENGQEGVEKVKGRREKGEKPFDLIFMDMHMPVMDGLQAAAILHEDEKTPIVAMTANIMTGDVEQYKNLGMDGYLGKPFTSQELWRCLLNFLSPVKFQKLDGSEKKEDTKLERQLKTYFVKDNNEKYEEIIAALDAGDIRAAHRLAHTLKSNAALIGKTELQKIAAGIETALKGGVNTTSKRQLDTLRVELHIALDEMAEYFPGREEKPHWQEAGGGYDEKAARELLDKLAPLLKSGNPECLNMIDGLRAIPGSDELAEKIEDFCFEEASMLLNDLKERLEAGQWKIR